MTERPFVLPPDLHAALSDLGAGLARGDRCDRRLDRALELLDALSPSQIGRADAAIAWAAALYHHEPPGPLARLLRRPPTLDQQIERTPGLEHVLLFHRDGRTREAALERITGPLPAPFRFAAVAWRLNDWAAPVREAAARAAARSFPPTSPEVVARTAAALLPAQLSWRRWGSGRTLLDAAFRRPDVVERLAGLIAGGTDGPLASVLRVAFRTPELDPYLERLAAEASQPHVRAAALEALIDGRAAWPAGHAFEWVDKPMGLRRRVTTFESRPLTVAPARGRLIAGGCADRSPVVRRVALAGVIRHLPGTPEGRACAARLLYDRSPSVRERAAFILRA